MTNTENDNTQKLWTAWYRLCYANNRTIHYHSGHTFQTKANTTRELISSALTTTTHNMLPHTIHDLSHIVLSNGYPNGMFLDLLKEVCTILDRPYSILAELLRNTPKGFATTSIDAPKRCRKICSKRKCKYRSTFGSKHNCNRTNPESSTIETRRSS